MKWVVTRNVMTAGCCTEAIYLPDEVTDSEVLEALGTREVPREGAVVNKAIAELLRRTTGQTIDPASGDYWIQDTSEEEWLQAETRRRREVDGDDREDWWAILGFGKNSQRLQHYVILPPVITEAQISHAMHHPADLRYHCVQATNELLALAQSVTGYVFDAERFDYFLELERRLST